VATSRRDAAAHRAILDATRELLEERGFAGASIEAIAARAGVGKQTIYRWWPIRADLVLEVYLERSERELPGPPAAGTVAEQVEALVRELVAILGGTDSGHVVAGLVAQAQLDPAFAIRFRDRFIARRREILATVLALGQQRGEVRADLDLDLAVDAFYGPIIYRLLFAHAPLDRAFADGLTRELFRSFGRPAAACAG
jgi:AcrR family transcriptional regulator